MKAIYKIMIVIFTASLFIGCQGYEALENSNNSLQSNSESSSFRKQVSELRVQASKNSQKKSEASQCTEGYVVQDRILSDSKRTINGDEVQIREYEYTMINFDKKEFYYLKDNVLDNNKLELQECSLALNNDEISELKRKILEGNICYTQLDLLGEDDDFHTAEERKGMETIGYVPHTKNKSLDQLLDQLIASKSQCKSYLLNNTWDSESNEQLIQKVNKSSVKAMFFAGESEGWEEDHSIIEMALSDFLKEEARQQELTDSNKQNSSTTPKKQEASVAPKKNEASVSPVKKETTPAPKKEEATPAPKKQETAPAPKKAPVQQVVIPKKKFTVTGVTSGKDNLPCRSCGESEAKNLASRQCSSRSAHLVSSVTLNQKIKRVMKRKWEYVSTLKRFDYVNKWINVYYYEYSATCQEN